MRSTNRFPAILVLAALLGVAGCAATDTREGTGGYVDDATVTTKVKSVLLDTRGVDSTEITVETFKGFLDSKTMIDIAVNAAETVNGVKSVTDDMTVKGQQGPR